MRTPALTLLALIAFAANSILCRLALGPQQIDAVSFTTIRLGAGAATLLAIVFLARRRAPRPGRALAVTAGTLFAYAICFSLAYRTLTAGTGALLLFGSVQVTMIGVALRRGERPRTLEWIGWLTALGGLALLAAPDLASPAPLAALLMAGAGMAWGIYSIAGRGVSDPLEATAINFAAALAPALAASAVAGAPATITPGGAVLAIASGAAASGLGYVVWFAALRGLTATRAATVQLAVPVLTAAGGVVLLGETIATRLVIAAVLILGGVALAIAAGGGGAASVTKPEPPESARPPRSRPSREP